MVLCVTSLLWAVILAAAVVGSEAAPGSTTQTLLVQTFRPAGFPSRLRRALKPPPDGGGGGGTPAPTTARSPSEEQFGYDFLFGAATAAYQIEGAWNESGRGPSVWDTLTHTHPELVVDGATGDRAADSYHLFQQDIDALSWVGFDFYRFSISWSRLLPLGDPSSLNQAAVDYYNQLIDNLLLYGIEPVVTMLHYDVPQYLQNLGGFASPLIVEYFRQYADVLFSTFGDRVRVWITHNEPYDFCVEGYGTGRSGPLVYATGVGEYLCAHHVLLSHAAAYHHYNAHYRDAQDGVIGLTLSGRFYYPATNATPPVVVERALEFQIGWFSDPLFGAEGNYPATMIADIGENSLREGRYTSRLPTFTDEQRTLIRGSCDFFAYNYYSSRLATLASEDYDPTLPPSWARDARIIQTVDPRWPRAKSTWLYVVPEGLRGVLNWFRVRYNNPNVLITENGFSDDGQLQDTGRIDYYRGHLGAILAAINKDGCNVIGYTAWSIIDNFEWLRGYSEKFGLYYVNFSSPELERVPKQSATFMEQVIRTRHIPSE
ncbi:myrosinase 1-like [Anopheles ziemanni]|uniref:myrosinase 1-like n=1 Tax=Anopheles coustani TaxID=139045 RepID=UPI002657D8E4|nr:myrosinase 1-like [Anopheles coustani]XP_058176278.1 myrosinase 1-like [Anopheles ziemanni]